MSDLTGLAVGDDIVVSDTQNLISHRKVADVKRVWLTDSGGYKFRRRDGSGEDRYDFGYGMKAMTVADWEVAEETERLTHRLISWGWVPRPKLTLPQLRRAAALLSEFESENNGGLL